MAECSNYQKQEARPKNEFKTQTKTKKSATKKTKKNAGLFFSMGVGGGGIFLSSTEIITLSFRSLRLGIFLEAFSVLTAGRRGIRRRTSSQRPDLLRGRGSSETARHYLQASNKAKKQQQQKIASTHNRL